MTSRLFAAIGSFSVRYRWPVLIGWVLITIVSVKVFPGLSDVAKDSQSSFLPASSPSVQAENLAQPFQDSKHGVATLIAARADGVLTAADLQQISSIETRVRGLSKVIRVQDFGLSPDKHAEQAQVVTNLPPFSAGSDAVSLVANIRATFPGDSSGVQFHLTGTIPGFVDQQSQSKSSQGDVQKFSFLFIIVLLLLAFRALLAPLVTLLPAALVLALASPVIAGATHLGVQVSAITQFILIVLVLGAGTDYGLFLVFRVREELRRGLEPKDAVRRAVATVGESITFSALIVMAALMSLIIAQFNFYQSLGPALALGIALMLIAGLTLLPALLAIFGRAVFWPSKARLDENPRANIYGRIAGVVVRRPMPVAIAGAIIFGAIALGQVGTTTAGFADQSAPTGTDSAAGDALISAHYGSANLNATEFLFKFATPIWSHADDLQTIQTTLQSGAGFATVEGPLAFSGQALTPSQLIAVHAGGNTLAAAALARFVSPDGRTAQYIGVEHGGAATPISQVPALRVLADRAGAAVHTTAQGVFGIQPFAYDVNKLSSSDLWHIIPVVAVLIAILLAIVMRSLVAPLYLVTSVLLSYLAALGLTALIFVHFGGQSGINFVLPFLMFVFLMALGSDYNVLVMTRIREESHHLRTRDAVRKAIGATGTTVTTAGLILGGTFAVLAFAGGGASGGSQIQQIGYGVAFGVVMDTFVVRTILVPAIVVLLGRRNWWPSTLWRQGEPVDIAAFTPQAPAPPLQTTSPR
ncbi:MAG TPA: MMPL family transporter [Candidatus Dormibacteraeota bacterium]|jgi:putative drug exporter of the RND superfamily|nr:MMPL family transporter [Candidatus Dormibacteraeota bacterium]